MSNWNTFKYIWLKQMIEILRSQPKPFISILYLGDYEKTIIYIDKKINKPWFSYSLIKIKFWILTIGILENLMIGLYEFILEDKENVNL